MTKFWNGLFQKKSKKEGGGWGDGISTGYLKNRMGKFQWSIKKEKESPGIIKKNSCGISMGFIFGLGNSNGCNTILWNFHGWSFILSGICNGTVSNLKIPVVFLKKVCHQPPSPAVWIFFGVAQWKSVC